MRSQCAMDQRFSSYSCPIRTPSLQLAIASGNEGLSLAGETLRGLRRMKTCPPARGGMPSVSRTKCGAIREGNESRFLDLRRPRPKLLTIVPVSVVSIRRTEGEILTTWCPDTGAKWVGEGISDAALLLCRCCYIPCRSLFIVLRLHLLLTEVTLPGVQMAAQRPLHPCC